MQCPYGGPARRNRTAGGQLPGGTLADAAFDAHPPRRPTPIPSPRSASPSCSSDAVPERLSLDGVRGRAFAYAPLDDPGELTVEGRVSGSAAWSTSKVLVVAAFLDTLAGDDPDR